MWFLRFQKFTSCVSAVCFCFVFCFFCDLSKQPITLHSVLKMWFLSVRKDLMRLHYRWWNNVTELSQDVAPRESSSLPPAAPLAFSGAKAVWTAARRSANQCEIKTSIQWLTHTHNDICTRTSADARRKHQHSQVNDTLLSLFLCAMSSFGREKMLQNGRFFFLSCREEAEYLEQQALVNDVY